MKRSQIFVGKHKKLPQNEQTENLWKMTNKKISCALRSVALSAFLWLLLSLNGACFASQQIQCVCSAFTVYLYIIFCLLFPPFFAGWEMRKFEFSLCSTKKGNELRGRNVVDGVGMADAGNDDQGGDGVISMKISAWRNIRNNIFRNGEKADGKKKKDKKYLFSLFSLHFYFYPLRIDSKVDFCSNDSGKKYSLFDYLRRLAMCGPVSNGSCVTKIAS